MHLTNVTLNTVLDILDQLTTNTTLAGYVTMEDLSYIRKRSNRESIEFLTKTLPLLGKALEKGLATGRFVLPQAFKPHLGTQKPRLLHNAFRHLFGDDGAYLDVSTPFVGTEIERFICINQATACLAIRQVTLLVYKAKLKHDTQQTDLVTEAFMSSEDHVWETTKLGHSQWLENPTFLRARVLVHKLVGGINPFNIKPKHGGGASAERRTPWDRYKPERFIPKLDAVYPYTEFFCTAPNGLGALCDELSVMPVDESPPARVCFVPKDSRGPRLISCEPSEYMFIQQGLMALMYGAFHKTPEILAQMDCEDQTRNQRAAREGSITGHLATLDLKEASDCVSYSLVRFLFPEDWIRAFDACRSESTIFPNGDEVYLWKFAPMGSACCFPVEAIVFWALTCAVVYDDPAGDLFPSPGRRRRYKHPTVRVFGDDIVCPTEHALGVCSALELAGLKVNYDKSYIKGPFRESCGSDWFLGISVRIVRLNHLPIFNIKTDWITKASAFRLLDFVGEIQQQYGPCLDAWVKKFLDSVTPHELPVLPERPSGSYSLGSWSIPQVADTRASVPSKDETKPYYGNCVEARLLMEVGVKQQIDISDWCHILRPMLSQAGEKAEVVGLKGRNRYKYKWVRLNCVTTSLVPFN